MIADTVKAECAVQAFLVTADVCDFPEAHRQLASGEWAELRQLSIAISHVIHLTNAWAFVGNQHAP